MDHPMALRPVIISVMLCATYGCSREAYLKQQVPWGYVLDVGPARDITTWTIAQNDSMSVKYGINALINVIYVRDRSEAEDAVAGYITIYQKTLRGWPVV